VNDDPPLITTERLDALTEANAAAARESFAMFRRTIRPDMLWGPFVGSMTRELQKFHEAFVAGKRPRLAIMTPPQHGKSSAAEDFIAWEAGKHPDWKTIYSSFSDELGVLRNMNLQRLFASPRYQHIFPNLKIGGIGTGYQCNSSLIEYVGGPGSFRNTTVNGAITGMEQNLGVLDDFVKGRAEANSKLQRDRTWNWFTDDFMSRFSKDSALLVICTRWHLDDLLGRLIQKFPKMRVQSFPAIAEKDDKFRRKGEPLFPALKPLGMLLEQKKLMSESSWQAEYQQKPLLVGSGEIPIEKLKVLPHFDRWDISATVLSVDKAGTEGGDGAQTAIVIMHKMKNGTFVIENVIAGHWGALDREKYIKAWADYMRNQLSPLGVSFKVVIEQEPGSGGKESAEASVRNLAGHNVFLDKPGAGRSKEVRAEPFCAQVQGGNVFLHAGKWVEGFLEECGNWPMGVRKDRVDASAQALHWLTSGTRGEYSPEVWKAAFG
jgi:phage terminase large subunit-like protein